MAWNGNNDSIIPSSSRNYMYGNKVFILDEITADNCAYLIGDLTNFVFAPENNDKNIMFIINSPGGDSYVMMNIIGLINVAKLNNIEVYTFVLGMAGSAASLIATQGDVRYMSDISRHFVHFGAIFDITTKHSEIEKTYSQNKEYADNLTELYLKACGGKLSREKLLEIQSDERGYLNAKECIKYGLVDTIIEEDLKEKVEDETLHQEFYKNYDNFIKAQKSKDKPIKKKTSLKTKKVKQNKSKK